MDDSNSEASSSKASFGSESYTKIGFTHLDMIEKDEIQEVRFADRECIFISDSNLSTDTEQSEAKKDEHNPSKLTEDMLKTNTIINFMIHATVLKLAYMDIDEDKAKERRSDAQKLLFSLGINSISSLLGHIPTINEKIKKKGKGDMFIKSTLELFIKLGVKRLTKRNQLAFFRRRKYER